VWSWLKDNWKLVIAVVVASFLSFAVYTVFKSGVDTAELIETQRQQIQDSHNQIDELERAVARERSAREELQRAFDTRINEIDAHYAREIDLIRRDRNRRVRELASNPEELDRRFDERFGIPH
jgi:type II secretory pathway pseudopilin PulG